MISVSRVSRKVASKVERRVSRAKPDSRRERRLVLLAADPLRDIRNTTRIEAMLIAGRVLERGTLHASIERARRQLNPERDAGSR